MYFFHDLYAHRLWAQRHATVGLISTYQLGSPGENARWGSGFDSSWQGGGGPPLPRAPTAAELLVSVRLGLCR